MFQLSPPRRRFSFVLKCAGALFLVALGDVLFFDKAVGSTLGLFALAWTLVVALTLPGTRKHRGALLGLVCAAVAALVLADQPSLLAMGLFWAALSSSVLLPLIKFHDAAQLAIRLLLQGLAGLSKIVRDWLHLGRVKRRPSFRDWSLRLAAALALPLAGAAIFIVLFANANPVVERLLSYIPLPSWDWFSGGRCILWIVIAVLVWPSLRPSRAAIILKFAGLKEPIDLPGVSILSITLSLLLFNVIFGIENFLDVAFLWSGARLPDGITLAAYAHRGAYPLIVTALLAGLFVLVTAQPDTDIGRDVWVRRLVVAWIGQNLVLVASSVIRTLDYIDAYMMTRLRLAALIWMALVAAGLALICWRMIARLSLRWLINATALALIIALGSVSMIDLSPVVAEWNVARAREAGGGGQPLDLGYLRELQSAALVPLAELEKKSLAPEFRDRVIFVREQIMRETADGQKDWGWTWRNARRLSTASAILGPHPLASMPAPFGRNWDGTRIPGAVTAAPLTPPAGQ